MTTPEPGKWYTVDNEAYDSHAPVYVKRVEFGMAYCTCQSMLLELRVDEWDWLPCDSPEVMAGYVTCSDVLQEQEVPDVPMS